MGINTVGDQFISAIVYRYIIDATSGRERKKILKKRGYMVRRYIYTETIKKHY